MVELKYQRYRIVLDNVSYGSADNLHSYQRTFRLDDGRFQATSQHSLRVFEGEAQVASCLLSAGGGASGVHKNSAIVRSDSLIVAVGPYLAALQLPQLELQWQKQVDDATCFGIYDAPKYQRYVSHGELSIAAVTYDGSLLWSNSGADIFTNGFSISDDKVRVVDWNGMEYVWRITDGEAM